MPLLFVYNANSGRLNSWLDIGHKLLSPQTYSCYLCALTHGLLSEREAWRSYRESAGVVMEFLHKDEFETRFGTDRGYRYPVVLRQREGGLLEEVIDAEEMSRFKELAELIERLQHYTDGE